MKRAVVIARGKVQKVGYRDTVQDVARALGVVGYVENLKDGNVRIVAEAEEEALKKFIKQIKVKKDFIDVMDALVEYEEATGEFEIFEIKYGSVPEELGDSIGAAIKYLGATNKKIDESGEENKKGFSVLAKKQDQMLGKQDETVKSIDRLDTNMNTQFSELDVKYGKIAENMEKILKEMKEERKQFRLSIEKLVKAILKSK